MTGIILIIIICFMSMLIAYLADILGKRLGKKRISIFGLRPRYTAMVVTILAGAIIALITFGTLISLSVPVRIMLLQTEEIQKQLRSLQTERIELRNEVKLQSDVLQSQLKEIETLTDERNSYENDLIILSNEIVAQQAELDEILADKKQIESTLEQLESDLEESQDELVTVNEVLDDMREVLAQTQQDKQFIEKEITHLEKERDEKVAEITTLNQRIQALNRNRLQLEQQIARMQTEDPVFFQGQRLYGFQIDNALLMPQIRDLILQSFRDFDERISATGCSIAEPSAEELVALIDKIKSSRAAESIILFFSQKHCYAGDKIPIEFMVFDQYVIYDKGVIIARERVTERLNVLEARHLIDKMILEATQAAHERGLLRDTQGNIFKLSFETLNEMAEQISRHRRPMIVKFVTKTKIERADYLDETNIELQISDAD